MRALPPDTPAQSVSADVGDSPHATSKERLHANRLSAMSRILTRVPLVYEVRLPEVVTGDNSTSADVQSIVNCRSG